MRVVAPAHVAEHEPHEIQRVVVVGIERERALQRAQRFVIQPAMVEHFAERDVQQRARGIEHQCALEVVLRFVDVAGLLLGHRELQQRADIVAVVAQNRAEFRGGVFLLAEERERPAQLPARVAVLRMDAQPLLQLGDAGIVVAGIEIRDLEIALRDLHFLVELERLHERGDGLFVQPLVVVEHTQVVVRASVRRIDPSGERTKNLAITFRGEHHHVRPPAPL